MISTKVTELKEIKEPNIYVSTGTKECYEVITDQQNGCYKQHISYKHEIPWEADYNLVQSADNKQAWGECASLCEGNSRCTFWTWASTSCSNCTRNRCHLLEGDGEPEIVNQLGHISGSKQSHPENVTHSVQFKKYPDSGERNNSHGGEFDRIYSPLNLRFHSFWVE